MYCTNRPNSPGRVSEGRAPVFRIAAETVLKNDKLSALRAASKLSTRSPSLFPLPVK